MIFYYVMAILLIIVDQLSKWWIVQNFALHEEMVLIPGLFSLFYIQNTGAAWGIFAGKMWFFYIITIVVVGYLIYTFHQYKGNSKVMKWGFSFILAGAIGNFIDRLLNGFVVDMFRLDFINFPIFNVADVCLTVGVALVIIYVLFLEKNDIQIEK